MSELLAALAALRFRVERHICTRRSQSRLTEVVAEVEVEMATEEYDGRDAR